MPLGRPRKDPGDDATERRRAQYRASKLRKYERARHDRGLCRRDRGELCPLLDRMPDR